MNVKGMKKAVDEMASHILFDYKGKSCGIDPLSRTEFEVWYGDKFESMDSVDSVMETPFFDGCSLAEIVEDIENLEM